MHPKKNHPQDHSQQAKKEKKIFSHSTQKTQLQYKALLSDNVLHSIQFLLSHLIPASRIELMKNEQNKKNKKQKHYQQNAIKIGSPIGGLLGYPLWICKLN